MAKNNKRGVAALLSFMIFIMSVYPPESLAMAGMVNNFKNIMQGFGKKPTQVANNVAVNSGSDIPKVSADNFNSILNMAKRAEQQKNVKLAFSHYENLIKNYPDKIDALKAYSVFCERNKYYLKAIELNKKLYSRTGNESYNFKIAEMFAKQGNISQATVVYNQIYRKNPGNLQVLKQLTLINYNHGNFNAAVPYCDKYVARNSDPSMLRVCGRTFFYARQNLKAKGALEKYIVGRQADYSTLKALADVYLGLKDYKKAAEIFPKLVALKKNDKSLKIKLGDVYMAAQEFDKARVVYQELLKVNPDNLTIMKALMNTYLAQNKYKEASELAEKILKTNPKDDVTRELLANLYVSQNNFAKAKDLYGEFVKSKPANAKFLKSLADVDLALNHFDEASAVLENLAKLNPKDLELKRKLADSYMGSQNFVKAGQIYSEFLADSPNDPEILNKLIDTSASMKNYSQAAEYLTKLMEIQKDKLTPDELKAMQIKLGNLYLAANDFRNAEGVFLELSSKYPGDFDILSCLADIYLADKRYVEAINVLGQALKVKPDSTELKTKLAKTYIAINEFGEAKNLLEELVKTQPENVELLEYLSDSYLALGQYRDAVVALNQLLTLKPSDKEVSKKIGNAYMLGCNFEQAKIIFENLARNYPDDIDVKKSLADIYLATGEYQDALNILSPVIQQHPEDVNLVLKFSNALLSLNKFDEARQILQKAVAVSPQNDEIKELLGDANLYMADYTAALSSYYSVPYNKRTEKIVYNMGEAYRLSKDYPKANEFYQMVVNSPKYGEKAAIGMAYIKIGANQLYQAKDDFLAILKADPANTEAKLGLAIAYNSTEDFFKAIDILNTLPANDRVNYQKAIAYYKLRMYNDAHTFIKDNSLAEAKKLNQIVINKMRFELEPAYQFHTQTGDVNTKVDFNRYGLELSKYIAQNVKLKAAFNITPYSSGDDVAKATGTLYSLGLEGRPTRKFAFDTAFGIKDFSNNKNMLVGKALFDFFANDNLKFNAGYKRYNLDQESLLSAAGLRPQVGPFANKLVGQVADNKYMFGYGARLPYRFFNYGGFNFGTVRGSNIPANFYKEGDLGLGKIVWTRPEGSLLDLAMGEYTLYATGYEDNRFGFGGANLNFTPLGSDGIPTNPIGSTPGTGGYFSPHWMIANKVAMHMRGNVSPLKSKYYLYGYMGTQNIDNKGMNMIWGASASLKINDDGRLGLGLIYLIENYEVATRQDFIVNLIMRL